jgi:hypothetical protein
LFWHYDRDEKRLTRAAKADKDDNATVVAVLFMHLRTRQTCLFPWKTHGAVAIAIGFCTIGGGCAQNLECSVQTHLTGSFPADLDWRVDSDPNCGLHDGHLDPTGFLGSADDSSSNTWTIGVSNDVKSGDAIYHLLVSFPASDAPTFPGSYTANVTFESSSDAWEGSCTASVPFFQTESWTRNSFVEMALIVESCALENTAGDIIQMSELSIYGHFLDS